METLVIVCIWLGIAFYKVSVRSRGEPRQVKTACLTCVNSLVTKTDRGEVLVNCFYGGTVRLVKVAVCECSGYAARGGRDGELRLAAVMNARSRSPRTRNCT